MLARYGRIETIPDHAHLWDIAVRVADGLARTLADRREQAYLFRVLATLRTDSPGFDSVEELRWTGAKPGFAELCDGLEAPDLFERAASLSRCLR